MSKTIVIAAGGTGGHLYPAIAVAEEIKIMHPDSRIVFIGTAERIEAREVPRAGFEFFPIDIKAPGKSAKELLRFPIQYTIAVRRSREILSSIKPCAFLGGGAYLSLPVAQAAKKLDVPIALLEINAVAGRANKALAGSAEKIFVAYPEAIDSFGARSRRKIAVIGTPVRTELSSRAMSREDARLHFGLDPAKRTVLVFGGSLGARSINEAMTQCANDLLNENLNIIWQTGKSANVDELRAKFPSNSICIREYINEMDVAYAAANLVVARAGASTLAELATLGKAAILVPYPLAVKNHQELNAKAFENHGAALVILDNRLKEELKQKVLGSLGDEEHLDSMRQKILTRENKDARKVVAQWLASHCHEE